MYICIGCLYWSNKNLCCILQVSDGVYFLVKDKMFMYDILKEQFFIDLLDKDVNMYDNKGRFEFQVFFVVLVILFKILIVI